MRSCLPQSHLSLRVRPLAAVLPVLAYLAPAPAATPELEAEFRDAIQPILQAHCYECHGNNDATRKADLNLEYFQTVASLEAIPDLLDDALFYVEEGEMPPASYDHQLSAGDEKRLADWLAGTLDRIENAAKNDPGHVVAPRINHLEYDRVVSDLTGVTIRAADFFPRDTGSGEGFTNVGADQQATALHLEKWLEAARFVASHARITALRGIRWFQEPQPSAANEEALLAALSADWALWHAEQEALQAKNDEALHALYLFAAWQYQHRAAFGAPEAKPEQVAAAFDPPLYPVNLERYHEFVSRDPEKHRASRDERLAELATKWQALPAPDGEGVTKDFIQQKTEALAREFFGKESPRLHEMTGGSRSDFSGNSYTPFVDYKDLDINLLATPEMQQPPTQPRKDPGPFYLNAEEMRRNASPEDLSKLDLLVAEVRAAQNPDLQKEAVLARQILEDLAPKAWRRPVETEELDALMQPYLQGRAQGLTLDTAVKDSIAAMLVSPKFLFRLREAAPDEKEVVMLEPHELASRLSFALWGTLPDTELRTLAASGELMDEEIYRAQVDRMIQDERSRFLADQFAAQWLHFANFAENASPDDQLFPEFNPQLAEDMEESLKRFFHDLFREDKPITILVSGREMPVSNRMAIYYGLHEQPGDWNDRRLESWLSEWQIRTMPEGYSGILTSGPITIGKSQPLRTSPILRGAWIVKDLLGTPMPEPPPNIPELSEGDENPDGLTIAEQMALHREDPACMSCHVKLDPVGLALENLDPAGRWREQDAAGNPLVTSGTSPEGIEIQGVQGLADYLSRDENVRAISRQYSHKLVGYLLGRAVEIGDRELIDAMVAAMEENEWKVMPAMQLALVSPQFLQKRNQPLQ